MNQPKPQWNLAFFIVPLIIASLGFLHFFPNYILPLLLIVCGLSVGKKVISVITTYAPFEKENKQTPVFAGLNSEEDFKSSNPPVTLKGLRYIWSHIKHFIALFNLLFLFGIGLMALIFLTATTQLEPSELGFENIANVWKLTFPLSIGLVISHLIASWVLASPLPCAGEGSGVRVSQSPHKNLSTKAYLTTQILLNFSSFVALLIGLAVAVFSIASALTRSLGADVFNGLQIQTMIASTVLMAPYLSKRWTQQWKKPSQSVGWISRLKRRNPPKNAVSVRRFKILSSSLLLILLITILSLITMPLLSDKAIDISLFSYLSQPGHAMLYWKLLIVAWGVAFAPLLAEQIIQSYRILKVGKASQSEACSPIIEERWARATSLRFAHPTILFLATGCVYWLGTTFLAAGGKDYFLTIIRQGIPALILTALPLLGLTLNSIKYLKNTYIPTKHNRKQEQDSQTLTLTLTQGLAFACVLYWTTSFSLLFPMLLMLVIPALLLFLVI